MESLVAAPRFGDLIVLNSHIGINPACFCIVVMLWSALLVVVAAKWWCVICAVLVFLGMGR